MKKLRFSEEKIIAASESLRGRAKRFGRLSGLQTTLLPEFLPSGHRSASHADASSHFRKGRTGPEQPRILSAPPLRLDQSLLLLIDTSNVDIQGSWTAGNEKVLPLAQVQQNFL